MNINIFIVATTTKKKTTRKAKALVDKAIKDYTNDPYFVKKREMSLKLLQKTGLPESFNKKKKVTSLL